MATSPDIRTYLDIELTVPENETKKTNFQNTLTNIQSKPLSPENIDKYASTALTDLVNLTDSILKEYCTDVPSNPLFGKELEDKAFSYFGLSNMNNLLDHIVAKQIEIDRLDDIINSVKKAPRVVVPPKSGMTQILPGEEEYKEKLVISRTKTILFILQNDFEIDARDSQQVELKTGILNDDMMRKLSYFMINIPSLNRTILCCDEEGNVTYVFDSSVLKNSGITPDDITELTKADINDLLTSDPKLGKRLIYTSKFVPKMIGLMTNLESNDNDAGTSYLYPKAPEGILSMSGIAKKFGISHGAVKTSIDILRDQLGETDQYRIGLRTTAGYTLEQQEKICQNLEARGVIKSDAPEQTLSILGLTNKLHISHSAILNAINELGDQLGETHKYRFGPTYTPGYSPEQQEMIRLHLEKKGLFSNEAPEGILPLNQLRTMFETSRRSLNKTIKEIADQLGETHKYRFGAQIVTGYTPEQQEMIRLHLEKRGLLRNEAPEGTLSLTGIAKGLGIDQSVVKNIIEELGDNIGETSRYKFGSSYTIGYTPQQQELVIKKMQDDGKLAEHAPSDILSIAAIGNKFGVTHGTIIKILEELGEQIGKTRIYKFNNVITTGFNLKQQERIKKALESKGAYSERAPEGVLSISGLAKKYRLPHTKMTLLIKDLGESLGQTNKYIFGSKISTGYTPEQQMIIFEALKNKYNPK